MAATTAALALAPLLALGLGAPPPPAPPVPAPVAVYPLDGDARDETGGGADGVVLGARPAEDRTGRPGAALAFGGRDLVDLGSRVEPEALTLMAWVRPGQRLRDGAVLSKVAPAAGRDRWLELRVDADGRPALLLPSMERPLRGPRLLAEGRWSHLAASYDGARAVLYVDGAPVAEAAAAPWRLGPGPALLGARPDPGGRPKKASLFLDGRLDDVRLYAVALPAWQVLAVVHPASRPPPAGDAEAADDAADLERIGALAAAFDRAVIRREPARLREVEARILVEIDQELAEARGDRGHGGGRRDVLRRAREAFAGSAGLRDLAALDERRAALAELSAAAWQELLRDLEEVRGPGGRPSPEDGGWGAGRRDGPPPAPPAGPRAMEAARFDALVAAVRREPFPDGQRRVLDAAMPGAWFSVAQVGRLVDLFPFSRDKLEVLRRVRGRLVDPDQAAELYGRFTFDADRAEARDLLQP